MFIFCEVQEGEIKVNRAPVLTMWVAAVAERQGFNFDEAVTFGKAISSLFAQSKGKRIGVIDDSAKEPEESGKKKSKKDTEKFEVFGNSVYGKTTDKGRFAVESGKAITPNTVKAYLHRAFKNDYDRVKGWAKPYPFLDLYFIVHILLKLHILIGLNNL